MRLRRIIPRFSLRTLVLFLLLVTSGMGLWWNWEPWETRAVITSGTDYPCIPYVYYDARYGVLEFIDFGSISVGRKREVTVARKYYDLYGRPVSRVPTEGAEWNGAEVFNTGGVYRVISPDGRREVAFRVDERSPGAVTEAVVVRDAATGEELTELGLEETHFSTGGVEFYPIATFADNALLFVRSDPVGSNSRIGIFRRRRPEWWWGVFYLWEFWLTAAFAAIFVWSVVRDRRALRATVPSPRPESGSARPGEEGLAAPRLRATGDDVGEGQDGG